MWGKMLGYLVDFVYPKNCVGCERMGVHFCSNCKKELEQVEQICPMCGKENIGGNVHKMCSKSWGLDGLTAVYSHEEKVMSKFLFRVKFEFDRKLLEILLQNLDFSVDERFDMVVPVPSSIYRRNWRGFNLAEVIANEVGRQLDLPVVSGLRRVKGGKQQSKIKNRKERFNNVKGIFKVTNLTENGSVLLVDDVFTSGATMREAAKVLKKSGARFVWGLVLARRV